MFFQLFCTFFRFDIDKSPPARYIQSSMFRAAPTSSDAYEFFSKWGRIHVQRAHSPHESHYDIRGRRDDSRQHQSIHQQQGIPHIAGSQRLWKDDHAPDYRRLFDAHVRRRAVQRQAHQRSACVSAQDQHGLPALRAVPASGRVRQYRLRPAHCKGQGGRN